MALIFNAEILALVTAGVQCPPTDAVACAMQGWRFVFNPQTSNCFSPVAVRNPPRLARAKDLEEKCSCYGLSMYDSYARGVQAMKLLERSLPRIRKTLGDHIAMVSITPADGVSTPPNNKGHFDFHPYVGNKVAASVSGALLIP